MKSYFKIASALAVCAAALLSASCVQEMKDQKMPEYITGITVSGQDVDFSEFETKVSYTDRLVFSWDNGDCLGIFPVGGDQVAFPLSDVGDGSSANFDGGAWALRSSYEYAAYYPFGEDNYHVKDMRIPVTYVGQRQVGNNSTGNLGEFSYMVCEATRPDMMGNVNLAMKQVGGVLRLTATIPAGVTVTSATLTDKTSDFIVGGKVDLSSKHSGSAAFVPEIVEPVYASSISIAVEDLVTEEAAEGQSNVILFCWLAPQDLTGHELELNLSDVEDSSYSLEITAQKSLVAGKSMGLNFGTHDDSVVDLGPLRLIAQEDGASLSLVYSGSDWDVPVLEYSTDGVNWNNYVYGTLISLPKAGDLVYFRGDNDHFSKDVESYINFSMDGSFAAKGSIMYLLDKNGADKPLEYACFAYLFTECEYLLSAPALPSENLAADCYEGMFNGCTKLTTAPELPAKRLAKGCYSLMFNNCKSLINAPELPAETLADYCYLNMFSYCKSLTTAPALPAESLATSCYSFMFLNCTSLTRAPELPAERLTSGCYDYMFAGCSKLQEVKARFTTDTYIYFSNWLKDTSTTGTFYRNPNATWTRENAGIPEGWTIIDAE